MAQLSAKDCHFLQEILHQLLSSGAKVRLKILVELGHFRAARRFAAARLFYPPFPKVLFLELSFDP